MDVRTSTIQYKGPDRLDITVKSGDRAFAPTWDMVMGHKRGEISDAQYTAMYLSMMRRSYHDNKVSWQELVARDSVTLVCFCRPGAFCHRVLLAEILVKLGATYIGEV